ncbi:hypothetical protein GCM10010252_27360 [Streptomyces aureoverticillatus]|nr:hypothetical protein GCM10010252_27360 [Streptomyces aureoverticillatus]
MSGNTLVRAIGVALAAVGLAVSATTTATADTNKNKQNAVQDGPMASVLSLVGGPRHTPGSVQAGSQVMDKAHATNNSVIDYVGGTDGPTCGPLAC